MNRYDIDPREDGLYFDPFTVNADTIEQAATLVAQRMWGRKASARRVTGGQRLSGVFQSFEPVSTTSSTSIGGQFHVEER